MLTQEELKRVLDYDLTTGEFTWKVATGARAKVGTIAGSLSGNGYKQIRVNAKRYYNHRLVFLYLYGEIPEQIDHINRNKLDNRLVNLRNCNTSENCMNKSMQVNNTTGFRGISLHKSNKHYIAHVQENSKILQKYFSTYKYGTLDKALEAAIVWTREKREELHKEFVNHGDDNAA